MTATDSDIRYQRLQQIGARSLQESIKALTLDRLLSCYPTTASLPKGSDVMEQALKQIAEFWRTTALKEFDTIYEERDIKAKFDELDKLIADARRRKEDYKERVQTQSPIDPVDQPVFFGSLTPSTIIQANQTPQARHRLAELQSQLDLVKSENDRLLNQLTSLNRQIELTAASILDSLQQIDSSVEASRILPTRSELTEFLSVIASHMT
jgi:kinetochore protein NNF1